MASKQLEKIKNVVGPHQERLGALDKKPYPCYLFWKGKKAGVYLPATKKAPMPASDVKALKSVAVSADAKTLKGHCNVGGGAIQFKLLNPENDKVPEVPELKAGLLVHFMGLGRDPKDKKAPKLKLPFAKVAVEVVDNLPDIDEAQGDQDEASGATRAKPGATAPAADQGADSPESQEWLSLQPTLAELFVQAMKTGPANRTQLEAAFAMATEKAEAGDFVAALKIAKKLQPALEKAAGEDGGAGQEVPKDAVPFQKSRVLWIDTRRKMKTEIGKLEQAIKEACAGDPELAPIADEAGTLIERLMTFDDRLEGILETITVTAEGPERTKLKTDAKGAIRDYAAALNEDFFKDIDSANGFVNVKVASTARASLAAIAKTLG